VQQLHRNGREREQRHRPERPLEQHDRGEPVTHGGRVPGRGAPACREGGGHHHRDARQHREQGVEDAQSQQQVRLRVEILQHAFAKGCGGEERIAE